VNAIEEIDAYKANKLWVFKILKVGIRFRQYCNRDGFTITVDTKLHYQKIQGCTPRCKSSVEMNEKHLLRWRSGCTAPGSNCSRAIYTKCITYIITYLKFTTCSVTPRPIWILQVAMTRNVINVLKTPLLQPSAMAKPTALWSSQCIFPEWTSWGSIRWQLNYLLTLQQVPARGIFLRFVGPDNDNNVPRVGAHTGPVQVFNLHTTNIIEPPSQFVGLWTNSA